MNIYKLDDSKRIIDIHFNSNNTILAKSDTIISIKNKVKIESVLLNGLFNSLFRKFFNSNSLFIQKIGSDDTNSIVTFANTNYEKIEVIDIDGLYYLNDGVFTLCDDTLKLGRSSQSFKKAFLGASGGFSIETLEGIGKAVIAANGHIKKIELKDEEITLDESHLLAWQNTLILEENKSNSKIANIKSGEFFSTKVSGTGTLYISSQKINRSIFSTALTILGALVGIAYSISELITLFDK